MGQAEMKLPLGSASIREVDILGSFRYKNTVSRWRWDFLMLGVVARCTAEAAQGGFAASEEELQHDSQVPTLHIP